MVDRSAGARRRDGGRGARIRGGNVTGGMTQTSFDDFVELARRGTFVPVWREIMADLLTPVSAFLKIAEHSDYAFLLESVEGGEHVGRYSFLGKDPFLVVRGRTGETRIEQQGGSTTVPEPFIDVLRRLMAEFHAPYVPELPRFTGGAVGYFDYDAAEWFEPAVALDRPMPDRDQAGFMVFDTVLAFDHVKHRILAIANARLRPGEDLRALYDFACAKLDFLERELERNLSRPDRRPPGSLEVTPNQTQDTFEAAVRRIQDDIAAGEIYQAVLSQRFDAAVGAPAIDVYRALRHINPSPYMFFIRMGGQAIIGASPEMLVRVEGGHVETHPIAGTRRRGATPEDDQRLADELRRSEKERAEHVMLVDLGRNDIGRVAAVGSVRVSQFMALERYSHVMHLVSRVEGRLADDRDRLDALMATFPAGTLTGAPKIRAMQILGALEPTRRGLYGGAVGYLDFAGNLDFCIAIRTIVMQGASAVVQAGAGIVADSHPAAEYEETRDKARALIQALEMATRGL
jgi:anthranilate synthase component 1